MWFKKASFSIFSNKKVLVVYVYAVNGCATNLALLNAGTDSPKVVISIAEHPAEL